MESSSLASAALHTNTHLTPNLLTRMQIYTHTHIYYTFTHVYIHTNIHPHKHTHTPHKKAYTQKAHIHMHTNTHTQTLHTERDTPHKDKTTKQASKDKMWG